MGNQVGGMGRLMERLGRLRTTLVSLKNQVTTLIGRNNTNTTSDGTQNNVGATSSNRSNGSGQSGGGIMSQMQGCLGRFGGSSNQQSEQTEAMNPKPQMETNPDKIEIDIPDSMLNTEDTYIILEKNLKNLQNEFVGRRKGDVNNQGMSLMKLENCLIVILDTVAQIFIDKCINCKIIVAAVQNSVFVRNCEDCQVITACEQYRMRDCMNVKHYEMCTDICSESEVAAFTPSLEIGASQDFIEFCRELSFHPADTFLPWTCPNLKSNGLFTNPSFTSNSCAFIVMDYEQNGVLGKFIAGACKPSKTSQDQSPPPTLLHCASTILQRSQIDKLTGGKQSFWGEKTAKLPDELHIIAMFISGDQSSDVVMNAFTILDGASGDAGKGSSNAGVYCVINDEHKIGEAYSHLKAFVQFGQNQ